LNFHFWREKSERRTKGCGGGFLFIWKDTYGMGAKDTGADQGCQMVYFQTKNPNLGKSWRALDCKMLIYILWTFGIFYDHMVHLMLIWYILSGFGIMYNDKSGNPVADVG
jgi:hypothetical protein